MSAFHAFTDTAAGWRAIATSLRFVSSRIVSDRSMSDVGALGVVAGLPGPDRYPSQPMVGQTRALLQKYRAAGGDYGERVIEETGHSPHIEKPEEFNRRFHAHLEGR